ncbi:MAG TPA: hypothetical protein VEL11_16690 [Candidatus Bathyarchaeia archaeon]|nr:hypothetical protein [Candidatus Bathyarchaeia archaeon]
MSKRENREVSHLTRVNKISRAAKTIVPKRVMEELKLDYNDFMEWTIAQGKNEKFARVRKI